MDKKHTVYTQKRKEEMADFFGIRFKGRHREF